MFSISQGTNDDDSQSDPHPEAGLFNNHMTQNSGPEDGHYMVTGVTEQTRNGHYMVTGVTEQTRNGHYMVTGVTEQTRNGHYMVTGATERHDMATGVQKESLREHYMMTGATERHDMLTGVQRERESVPTRHERSSRTKKSHTAPLVNLQESRKTVLPLNRNSAARATLRRSEQTKFCWRFNSWRTTTILQISVTILTEFPLCQIHLRQQCLRSPGNLKSSSCLKIVSKPVSKIIIS